MTTLLLVRHALCDHVGDRLAGRAAGVRLNAEGRSQGAQLAERLADVGVEAVYTSPLERARETAEIIAARVRAPVMEHPELTEIDFGEWTGKSFGELAPLDAWRRFNDSRATALVPGGECMADAQRRALRAIEEIASGHPESVIVTVSHADVIKAVLAFHLRMSLDDILRFDVAPASVSVVEVGDWGARVVRVNDVGRALEREAHRSAVDHRRAERTRER